MSVTKRYTILVLCRVVSIKKEVVAKQLLEDIQKIVGVNVVQGTCIEGCRLAYKIKHNGIANLFSIDVELDDNYYSRMQYVTEVLKRNKIVLRVRYFIASQIETLERVLMSGEKNIPARSRGEMNGR